MLDKTGVKCNILKWDSRLVGCKSSVNRRKKQPNLAWENDVLTTKNLDFSGRERETEWSKSICPPFHSRLCLCRLPAIRVFYNTIRCVKKDTLINGWKIVQCFVFFIDMVLPCWPLFRFFNAHQNQTFWNPRDKVQNENGRRHCQLETCQYLKSYLKS